MKLLDRVVESTTEYIETNPEAQRSLAAETGI